MAKNRYINTRFWSDNFISELNPLDRYLFLYFLTNEHTNICGIYEIPLRTISFETGIEIDMLKKMIKRLEGKIYYVEGWIYIKNFAKHQAINEKVEKGIENAKKLVPKKIWLKIKELDTLSIGDDRVSIGCQLPEPESEPELEPKLKLIPFEDFWSKYPSKKKKKEAERVWNSLPYEIQLTVIADIPRRQKGNDWKKEGGKYIPHPTSYLRGERWTDTIEDQIIIPNSITIG